MRECQVTDDDVGQRAKRRGKIRKADTKPYGMTTSLEEREIICF